MGLSNEYDQRQFLIIIIFFQMVLFNVMHYDLSLKRGHVCDNVPLQLSSLPWLSSWPLYQWPGPEIWKSWHWQPEDPFSPSPRDGAWPPPTWRHLHPWRLPSHHRMESPLDKQESHVNQQLLLISRDQLLLSSFIFRIIYTLIYMCYRVVLTTANSSTYWFLKLQYWQTPNCNWFYWLVQSSN